MASFGHLALGTLASTPASADRKFCLQTTAPEDGVVTKAYVDSANNSTTDVGAARVEVYDFDTMALLDQSDVQLYAPAPASGRVRRWEEFVGLNATVKAGASYVLAFHVGPVGGTLSFWYDSGVGVELIADDPFLDGAEASFGTFTQSANAVAIYVDYTPAATALVGVPYVYVGDKYGLGVG